MSSLFCLWSHAADHGYGDAAQALSFDEGWGLAGQGENASIERIAFVVVGRVARESHFVLYSGLHLGVESAEIVIAAVAVAAAVVAAAVDAAVDAVVVEVVGRVIGVAEVVPFAPAAVAVAFVDDLVVSVVSIAFAAVVVEIETTVAAPVLENPVIDFADTVVETAVAGFLDVDPVDRSDLVELAVVVVAQAAVAFAEKHVAGCAVGVEQALEDQLFRHLDLPLWLLILQ